MHISAPHLDSGLGCGTGGQASQAIGQHRVCHEANQALQKSWHTVDENYGVALQAYTLCGG